MTTETMTVEVRLAWWVLPYVNVLVFFCNLMGTVPDEEKLGRVMKAAVRVKQVKP